MWTTSFNLFNPEPLLLLPVTLQSPLLKFLFSFFCYVNFKVAGAAAAAGLSLGAVAAEAKHASEVVGTMGVALSVCTLPGQVTSERLGQGKMELGLGIVSGFLGLRSAQVLH